MTFRVPSIPIILGLAAVITIVCTTSAFTPPRAFRGPTRNQQSQVFGLRLSQHQHVKATFAQDFHMSSTNTAVSSLIQVMDRAGLYTDKEPKNLYQVLGASVEDSPAILKKKYVALAKKSHPDIITRDSAIDFSEVAAAYAVLSDPVQRRKYDRQLLAEDWVANIFYLLGGLADLFVIICQVILGPLSQQIFQYAVSATSTNDEQHGMDTNDWFFATMA